jgi:hypothetical protein
VGDVTLPTKKREIIRQNPKFMVLFSKPKIGKTTAVSLLEDNLIIEMEERGADFVSGLIMNANTARELLDIARAIEEAGNPYKYITLDTATAMEDKIINDIAVKLYQATAMGKDFKGGDMRKLPMGAGYGYLKDAFFYIIDRFTPLCNCLILLAHCNEKQINKDGKEMFEMEMDLAGKLKRNVSSRADAIGFMYRKDNQTFVNFNGGGDAIIEARSPHLANKEFVLIEKNEKGQFINNWNQIFI